jgi:hypothetical protein
MPANYIFLPKNVYLSPIKALKGKAALFLVRHKMVGTT